MNPSNGSTETSATPPEQGRPPVNPPASQADAAEVIAQLVRWMIEDGHPPEPDSPLWQYVNRAA